MVRDRSPVLLHQLPELLGPLLGPRQHRLRGLVRHLTVIQIIEFPCKIRILNPAVRGLQIGALRRQVVHRRLMPILRGSDVGAIQEFAGHPNTSAKQKPFSARMKTADIGGLFM